MPVKTIFSEFRGFFFNLFRSINLFFPGILLLVVFYLLTVKNPAGQDALILAGEKFHISIAVVFSAFVWMIFTWLSSRILSTAYLSRKKEDIAFPAYNDYYIWLLNFPRILACFIPVILQIGALSLPVFNNHIHHPEILIAGHLLYYWLIYRYFVKRKLYYLLPGIALGIIYLIWCMVFMEQSHALAGKTVLHWKIIILFFFLMQTILIFIFYKWDYNYDIRPFQKFQNENVIVNIEKKWIKLYNFFALIIALLFALTAIYYPASEMLGSISILLLAMGLWTGLIYLINYQIIKTKVNLWIPLFLYIFIAGKISDRYLVETIETTQADSRPGINEFLDRWISDPDRLEKIRSVEIFPVYLVISDGGASRSGFWVGKVLSELHKHVKDFPLHLLSLSGTSGGSVGNAAYFSYLRSLEHQHTLPPGKEIENFFASDFLSYSFSHYLGTDLLWHGIPFKQIVPDRARALEKAMERSGSELISEYFKGSLDTIFTTHSKLPLLIMNATHLNSGKPSVISNARLSGMSARKDILSIVNKNGSGRQLRFSTAVVMGARFPYISPAGNIDGESFVDGGYFDNSGGGVTQELLEFIKTKMKDSTQQNLWFQFRDKLKFRVIHISNGNYSNPKPAVTGNAMATRNFVAESALAEPVKAELHPLLNDLAAPLLTIIGTFSSQTGYSNSRLSTYMRVFEHRLENGFIRFNLPIREDGIDYPMNWVISEFNLERIRKKAETIDKSVLQRETSGQ